MTNEFTYKLATGDIYLFNGMVANCHMSVITSDCSYIIVMIDPVLEYISEKINCEYIIHISYKDRIINPESHQIHLI